MKEIVTYLTFDGECREAMSFYKQALGGELTLMKAGDYGTRGPEEERIMHATLKLAQGTLMASDSMSSMRQPIVLGNNFSISVDCDDAEEQDRYFAALSAGGTVTMDLQDTFWGARFGMLKDKFGIAWMFNYDKPKA